MQTKKTRTMRIRTKMMTMKRLKRMKKMKTLKITRRMMTMTKREFEGFKEQEGNRGRLSFSMIQANPLSIHANLPDYLLPVSYIDCQCM